MKNISRAIALLLVLLMSFTLISAEAFADSEVNPDLTEYGAGYIAFGDSYTRGIGGSDSWYDELFLMDGMPGDVVKNDDGVYIETTNYCRNVTGCFAKRVADAIGCNTDNDMFSTDATYWPVAQNAMSLAGIMDLCGIEDNYFDSRFFHATNLCRSRYRTDLYYYGSPNRSVNEDGNGKYVEKGVVGDINELIADAKLITVELGMGDILNRSYTIVEREYFKDPNFLDPTLLPKAANTLIATFNEGFAYWEEYFPVFLNYLKHSSDAEIVVLGAANPVFNLPLADATALRIGTTFSAITAKMNEDMKKFCEEFDCIYVDISNAETGITEMGMSLLGEMLEDLNIATHPTAIGHEQIADAIIEALLERKGVNEAAAAKDIVIDVGRYTELDYVSVNGIITTDYELNGRILTVHCNTVLANKLTIGAKLNGKLSVTTYQVVYNDGGYTAYRMFTTNNVFRVLDNVVSSVKSSLSSIFPKLP